MVLRRRGHLQLHLHLLQLGPFHLVLGFEVLEVRHGLQGVVGLSDLGGPGVRILVCHLHLGHGQRWRRSHWLSLVLHVDDMRLSGLDGVAGVACSHGFGGPDRAVSRFTAERSIHLSWVIQRLHVGICLGRYRMLRHSCLLLSAG